MAEIESRTLGSGASADGWGDSEGEGEGEAGESEVESVELEEMEADLKEMAQKVKNYRETLPDQLKGTFVSVLCSQRPLVPLHQSGSEPGPSDGPNSDAGGDDKAGEQALLAEDDEQASNKLKLLKEKIFSNVSSMRMVLKRTKECIARIDKLDSFDVIVHPAFKRMRTSG